MTTRTALRAAGAGAVAVLAVDAALLAALRRVEVEGLARAFGDRSADVRRHFRLSDEERD